MEIFQQLVEGLIEKNYHIACAESCTGGMFASSIVSVADASKVLDVSFVTYARRAKTQFLFVPEQLIDKYGLVSEQTAIAMAAGAAKAGGAQIGVGISGVAGPSGGTEQCPVGTVCLGFYVKGKTASKTFFCGDVGRNEVRRLACENAAVTLLKLIKFL